MDISTTSLTATTSRRCVTTHRPASRTRPVAVLARLLSPWLDARLARGVTPDAGALVTARAADLVSRSGRDSLAAAWEQVLDRADQPCALVDPRAPIAGGDVRAARGEIAELVALLRSSSPVTAREVARARALLTDGAGPLHVPGTDLGLQVALVVADLAG